MIDATRDEYLCADCGGLFARRSHNGPIPKRCPACMRQRTNRKNAGYRAAAAKRRAVQRVFLVCEHCTVMFERNRKGPVPKRCPACRALRASERAAERYRRNSDYEYRPFPCEGCGITLVPIKKGHTRKRCDPCAAKKRRQQIEEWYRRHPDKLLAKWRAHKQRRRAQKRGTTAEPFAEAEIFERDRWTCGICALPVDASLVYPDPMSRSLDHIIPLSLGGPHTRENVRLAHLTCNVLRGNRIEADL